MSVRHFLYLVATDQKKGWGIQVLKSVLGLLSCLYGFVVLIIGWAYRGGLFRTIRLARPVVSVGNMTLGGVGKTPLVELIAAALKEKNIKPVVLIRGYMSPICSRKSGVGRRSLSDEARMLVASLGDVPVLVGADRVKNAVNFLKGHTADIFLLDDGFQHRRIFRQLDIVAIDATDPWGNGCLIPRGILREPFRALRRAHMVVLTKTDLGGSNVPQIKARLQTLGLTLPVIETIHQPCALVDVRLKTTTSMSFLKGKTICSFCSIGHPKTFEMTLVNLGAQLAKSFSFIDHHVYEEDDIARIARYCQADGIDTVVTTQKDAVKLEQWLRFFPASFKVLSLQIKISIVKGKEEFFERIDHLLQR
ncbi:MAG TPA: tetraacyldisaccharide 4'-kinase [Candidatus Omnitrophica bacterium]|nr:MAG: tetraacyldisaccharide 4'-kinase [Omnitrophica WOR_2 bacterium GWA2_45_18]HBR15167.1 tetraacyldisaccharide 4'-kinase [Candidatus Omnitrophota bacterium]